MLDALFKPKAVAVIGASAKELNIGHRIIRNLVDFGFKGSVYPINPKVNEIRGVKAYKSILDVPTDVDVVHMAIPASSVPEAMEDCGRKGVKLVILNGGGFSETGPEGAAIEEKCLAKARHYGMRIFGPNCQGIINTDPSVKAYCNFTFTMPEPGAISIVALSGGVASLIHQTFANMRIGTRMYASNGNACDVSIPEIIRYYGRDEGTKVIVLYVEGLREPGAFLQAVREVASKKPILAMKAGRTEEGARAAASHTGGLAKQDIVTDLIFEKAGIVSFLDEGELCQAAAAFVTQPIPRGNRVGIITNTGGPAVIATDVLVKGGLTIPALSRETTGILKEKLFPEASISNPVDVLATAGGEHFRAAIDALMEDPEIDSVFINFVTAPFVDTDAVAREIAEANKAHRKPLICNLMTDVTQWPETVRILKDGGVPYYDFPGTAARVLIALTRYGKLQRRDDGEVLRFEDVDCEKAEAIIHTAHASGRKNLSAAEVYGVLSAYGINAVDGRIAGNADEAEKAASEIGFPVVVKIDSDSIAHKSDVGGVAINLENADAVRRAILEMEGKIPNKDAKFLVQKYLPGGREVIVGAKAEHGLGHIVMFGIGGIHVEVLKDTVFKLAPLTGREACEMVNSLKGAALLNGTRGEERVDKEAIAEIIARVSQLTTELPAIQEMDLNPVIAYKDGAIAVDGRILL